MAIEYVKMLKNRTFCQIKIAKVSKCQSVTTIFKTVKPSNRHDSFLRETQRQSDTQKITNNRKFKVKKDMKESLINGMISREWFENGPRMDRVKSRISPMRPLLTMLALLMVCLFGVNEKAWGAVPVYNGSTWYSLYDTGSDYSVFSEYFYEKDVFAPTKGSITFEYKKYSTLSTTGSIQLWENTSSYNSTNITVSNIKNDKKWEGWNRVDDWYSTTKSGLSANICQIKFKRTGGDGVSVRNASIPLAKHILLDDNSTYGTSNLEPTIPTTYVEATTEAIPVNFRSFLTNGNISITLNDANGVFFIGSANNTTITSSAAGKSYAVGSNACAAVGGPNAACAAGKLGNIANYSFNVYFRPKAAITYSGSITITDGTSTATVTLSGTGKLNENAITWTPDTITKKNWNEELTGNATATNNESGCPSITYTSSNTNYATVSGNVITFKQAGAGKTVKITANQAANYKYKAASLSRTFTIKSVQSLAYNNANLDVSVNADDKNVINLDDLQTSHVGDGAVTYAIKSGNGAVLSGNSFYSTVANTVVITATAANTSNYEACSTDFTVTVNKRTPTIVFAEPDHIYSGNTLDNMAKVQYNDTDVSSEQVGFWYWFDENSWFSKNSNDTMQIMVSTQYSQKTKATLHVTTKETSYYKSVTASHEYDLEVKRTPEFYLNGVLLDKNVTTNLNLEVDETATFTFDKITTGFQYPKNPSHYTYNNETGVLTATVAGDETFFFNEPGDGITFQHQCNLHLYVRKHETELELSSLVDDNAVWMVDDSVAESSIYTLTKGDANVPVVISSDKPGVIAKENGKWVAKGKGSAVLTIAQVNSDKWTGDTITRTINVNRYDPVFDWSGLPDTLNFNTTFVNPVRSTSDGAITYKSNKSAVTVTNDSTTLHTAETADNAVTITAIQKPTYKYEGKTATKTVKVLKLRNHVKVEVKSNETYLAVRKKTEGDVSWVGGSDNAIRLGGSKTGIGDDPAWDWYDKYIDVKFEGVPKNISFTTGVTSGAATANVTTFFGKGAGNNNGFWYMIEYPEGESEQTIWADAENNNPGYISRDLKPNTNKVRICYTGNFAGYVKNLTITERTELSIDGNVESLDFGSTDAGSNATKKNFTFDWYNLNPLTLSIEGGDGKYSVRPSSISSKKDSFALNEPVEVSYIHTAGGTHNADLVISEGTTELKRIPLAGTTNKVTPAIIWKENLSPMSRGENVTDPAEAIVELVYTSSDSTVVDVEGNVLKPLKKGTATITASYDGSESLIYNSNSSTTNVLVTNLAVQHINWTRTFTRLKWTDDPALSDKNTADFGLEATVSYYDPETEQEVEITDRAVTFTSGNDAVVQVLEGNILHVVGQGTTTLTAHIDGIVDSLYEATKVREVIVSKPTLDCETWVWATDKEGSIRTINSVEYDLNGVEADSIFFDAWREPITVVIEYTDGDLYLAEVDANDHESLLWHAKTEKNSPTNYRLPLKRETKKVKFYTQVGATGYHNFSGVNARVARYLELENTKNKKTHAIHLTAEEAKPGVAVEKTFTVNYSNITDQLDVELKHGDKFSIESGATIGNECGDKGNATVRVRFLSNDVDLYKDTLLVHNLTDTVYVYLSADVDKHHPQITWEPATTNLKTTDNVTFDATTSASAAGLTISYAVTAGSDVASVDAATGVLTIIKDGYVTIEARCEGNNKYYDAEPVPYTFHIEKVTPTITKNPKASDVTLPATLAASTWTEDGEASVDGTFAWTNPSTSLVAGDVAYEVTFTPENTNWYNTTTCMVTPHVSKASQTIDWSFNATEMYGNANYTFDATASSGLAVTYSSSKNDVATVNDQNKLVLHKAGESVTITATQAGDETYLPVSESRTFTVLYWEPTIMENPVGGTMYVGHVLSDASLTGGRAEVGGQEVEGSFVWQDANEATINVPGPATHNAIFIPQNGNFFAEVVCENIPLTVLRYQPHVTSNTLSADGIEFPLTLEHSNLHGEVTTMDYSHVPYVEVTGHVEWKEPSTILRPGNQSAIALFVPDNTDWYANVEIPVSVQVTGGYVFNGDNTNWTEEGNWASNLIPTGENDPVLINQNVEITSEVTVGSLTIKEGVDVVVKNGGVLTIGEENSETRTQYGNLYVEDGGQVILGNGELKVNNFVLEAQLGDNTAANHASSGQVKGVEKLNVTGDAYFRISFDPRGAIDYGWYDFTVPFEVEVLNGVYDSNGNKLTYNADYAVMDFSEAKRAVNAKYWNWFSGTLQPNKLYSITFDDEKDWNTFLFKRKSVTASYGGNAYNASCSENGETKDRGWNGMGNGTLRHCQLNNLPEQTKIQVYDHAHDRYVQRDADEYTYAVGTAFFVQVDEEKGVDLTAVNEHRGFLAPAHYQGRTFDEFRLALTAEGANDAADHLWVSASEEATGEYVIGHDLVKMGTPTSAKVAQMWCARNNINLCDIEMPLVANKAQTPLSIFAPKAGLYEIAVERTPEDATLYLTYNGRAIWNLSMSAYEFDLEQGTTEGYGLRIVASEQTTTDIENGGLLNDENGVRKVMIDDVIYIVTPEGKMYDIVGKGVKF